MTSDHGHSAGHYHSVFSKFIFLILSFIAIVLLATLQALPFSLLSHQGGSAPTQQTTTFYATPPPQWHLELKESRIDHNLTTDDEEEEEEEQAQEDFEETLIKKLKAAKLEAALIKARSLVSDDFIRKKDRSEPYFKMDPSFHPDDGEDGDEDED